MQKNMAASTTVKRSKFADIASTSASYVVVPKLMSAVVQYYDTFQECFRQPEDLRSRRRHLRNPYPRTMDKGLYCEGSKNKKTVIYFTSSLRIKNIGGCLRG